jgi:hypothetical protein
MATKIAWMISAEPGWKALYGIDGDELGRSRVIGWAQIASADKTTVVGIVVDRNDPTQLVPATEITDPSGGTLIRYGFSA